MSSICEKSIRTCISASCDNPIFSGIEGIGYVFNKSDIESMTTGGTTDPNVITEINMKEVSAGVNYTGFQVKQINKQPFSGTNTAMNEGTVQNTFTETVQFLVADHSPAAAMLLDNIANGKFVFVLVNEYTGSDSRAKYQVYGAKKGLVCSEMTREAYSDENNGAWSVTLTAEGCPNRK